ncbi:DMT family transporter [Cellulosilyticum ruminicola]|uniref:DMT family transporter n=1 Tax=Cellulosilyticum ruminicola TaxID=425254 RepID=UPI002E8E00B0|nr:DMT family transporter [Cellulosilyticum ruminicola]
MGIVLINLDGTSSGALFSGFNLKGDGSVILAAFILSAASIYGKRITQHQDTFIVTGFQLTIGGFILILAGYLLGGSIGPFTLSSIALLLYMAFLSAVAFSLWAVLLKYNSVGKVAIYNCLIPVFGAFLSAIFLGENIFELKNIIALILVCLGIYIVNRTFTPAKFSVTQNS